MNKVDKITAKRFILNKQGLSGGYKFFGSDGIMKFIKQAGCVQYDPIDSCGRSHSLALLSRIENYSDDLLFDLLYKDRRLFDWYDKNMSICLLSDWSYFKGNRDWSKQNGRSIDEVNAVADEVLDFIDKNGPVTSSDLEFDYKIDWSWAPTTFSRAVLDTLYLQGLVIIHSKKGTRKSYDIASKHIPKHILDADDPNITKDNRDKWHILRRMGSVGLLWRRGVGPYLGTGLKAKDRQKPLDELCEAGLIKAVRVEGFKEPLYYKAEDEHIFDNVFSDEEKRTEFIAPLDNMIWDRQFIEILFDFHYRWEIYTPIVKRKYGYYTLPILHGDKFIGRIEPVRNRKKKVIDVKNIWWEDGVTPDADIMDGVNKALVRLAEYNGCAVEEIK